MLPLVPFPFAQVKMTFHLPGKVMSEIQTRANQGKRRSPRSPGCKAIGNESLSWNTRKMLLYSADSWPVLIWVFFCKKFEERNISQGQDTSVPRFPGQNATFRLLKAPSLTNWQFLTSLYFLSFTNTHSGSNLHTHLMHNSHISFWFISIYSLPFSKVLLSVVSVTGGQLWSENMNHPFVPHLHAVYSYAPCPPVTQ